MCAGRYPSRNRDLETDQTGREDWLQANLRVEGRDRVGLAPDEVIQAVRCGGVDEAVTYPLCCLDAETG